jgi:hypothetical protein
MLLAIAIAASIASPADPGSEVTIYNQGFGLIKETRTLNLKSGRQTVAVEDVAAQIEPSSVGIRSLTAADSFEVLEQNYQFDLISPMAILNKSVGKRVRLIRNLGNTKDVLEGTLISSPTAMVGTANGGSQFTYNGLVIRTDDGRIVLDPTGEIEVLAVPEGLISVPTLLWQIDSARGGTNKVELSYLTRGINWSADYVMILDGTNTADFKGWVTVDNQAGVSFVDAKLKLLAGDVNRVMPQFQNQLRGGGAGFGGGKADTFKEESLFEYHLYTMQRPATVRNKEIKQLSLLEGNGIQYQRKLIVDALRDYGVYYPQEGEIGTGNIKPVVRVEFLNSKENQLGMPLPKGKVRVYQRDKTGSVQMLGEDMIDHTPKDERLSLVVGKSFDMVAGRKRMNFRRISDRSFEETYEIELRNRKEVADTVHVLERHYGDWQVTEKSMAFTKRDAMTMEFVVPLKAGEVKKITYTIVTKW